MSDAIQVNTPPHSVEAEQAVLGAVILDSDRLITASERSTRTTFIVSAINGFLRRC